MHYGKIQPLTIKNHRGSSSIKELVETTEENKRTQNRQESRRTSIVVQSISLIVLHVLDTLLLIILLPFIIWQWIYANDRLRIILKVVAEVTLELIMWVIFAGVSIAMTTVFVLDDSYFRNDEHQKLEFVKTRNASTSSGNKRVIETQLTENSRQEAT
ncbi:uncharacterized protein LOC100878590 [Megachile rotundata]|uniref:uncharacterized protein LOC100878590 n=1 Tax=Megachile rotundata TaxID=143995 RepID=UPI000258DC6A|nr:PREDICTED: uncharacterized protein LOC100878590 [Megachile rotundata]